MVRCPVHTVDCEECRTFDLQVICSRTCTCMRKPEVKKLMCLIITVNRKCEMKPGNHVHTISINTKFVGIINSNLYVAIMNCRVKLQLFWRPRTSLACFGDSAPFAEKTCRSLCRTRRLTGGRTLSTAANTATPTLRLQRGRGLGKWLRIRPVTSSPLGLQVLGLCEEMSSRLASHTLHIEKLVNELNCFGLTSPAQNYKRNVFHPEAGSTH